MKLLNLKTQEVFSVEDVHCKMLLSGGFYVEVTDGRTRREVSPDGERDTASDYPVGKYKRPAKNK